MSSSRLHQLCSAVLALTTTASLAAVSGLAFAMAPYSEYSCRELWLERNGIYANKGYCFQTARGRAVFGKGCHSPYGKLNQSERRTASEIRKWERIKGCAGG